MAGHLHLNAQPVSNVASMFMSVWVCVLSVVVYELLGSNIVGCFKSGSKMFQEWF